MFASSWTGNVVRSFAEQSSKSQKPKEQRTAARRRAARRHLFLEGLEVRNLLAVDLSFVEHIAAAEPGPGAPGGVFITAGPAAAEGLLFYATQSNTTGQTQLKIAVDPQRITHIDNGAPHAIAPLETFVVDQGSAPFGSSFATFHSASAVGSYLQNDGKTRVVAAYFVGGGLHYSQVILDGSSIESISTTTTSVTLGDSRVATNGRYIAFITPGAEGAELQLYDINTNSVIATGVQQGIGLGGIEVGLSLEGNILAFGSSEYSDVNPNNDRDYNFDGDTNDRVIRWIDVNSPTNVHIGPTIDDDRVNNNLPQLLGSDGRYLSFTVYETTASLNGDMDVADVVVQLYDTATSTVTNTGGALDPSGTDPTAGITAFTTRDGVEGTKPDPNNDGDFDDFQLRYFNVHQSASMQLVNTNITLQDYDAPNTIHNGSSGHSDGQIIGYRYQPGVNDGFNTNATEIRFIRINEGVEAPSQNCTISWDGGAGTFSWHDAANWSTNVLPTTNDDVCISLSLQNITVLYSTGNTVVRSIHATEMLQLSGGTLSIAADSEAQGGLALTGASTLRILGRVNLDASDVTISAASKIDANGTGYGPSQGPGAGSSLPFGSPDNAAGSGAGHGGRGGDARNANTANVTTSTIPGGSSYNDPLNPTEMGSGGGNNGLSAAGQPVPLGGSGGGAILLDVSGTLHVDGMISANGQDGGLSGAFVGGGGSGGSIQIHAGSLGGAGTIRANGGLGRVANNQNGVEISGGGAGGRIAIYSDNLMGFTGTTQAKGGVQNNVNVSPLQQGEDGTIAYGSDELQASVGGLCDSGTPFTSCVVTSQHFLANNQTYSNHSTVAQSGGQLYAKTGWTSTIHNDELIVRSNATPGIFVQRFGALSVTGDIVTIEGTVQGSDLNFNINNLTIASTGVITADGLGHTSDSGPGAGGSITPAGAGGGYGGKGGTTNTNAVGGNTYGDAANPTDFGSGGGNGNAGGGAGGGRINIRVDNSLIIQGRISADGDNGTNRSNFWMGGGGSGGSILIHAGAIAGNGVIRSHGGIGPVFNTGDPFFGGSGGGGGGGRVCVYYDSTTYSGSLSVNGGTGFRSGGVGTQCFVSSDTTPPAPPSTPQLDPSSDTGAIGDNVTADNTPTLNGTAEPGSTVTLLADGQPAGSSVANAGGAWSITLTTALTDGSRSITARATDAAGNVSAMSNPLLIVIDTIAPETSIVSSPPAISNSSSATFDVSSNDASVTFEYSLDGGAYAQGTDPQTFNGLSDGSHTLAVRARDAAGNVDVSPASYAWTVDTLAPAAPTSLALDTASDTGAPGDHLTSDNTPTVNGAAEPGSSVTLFVDGQSAGSTSTNAGGQWSFTIPTALGDGAHSITAKATDSAGNVSELSDELFIVIDTIAPETTIVSSPPSVSNSSSATFDVSSNDSGVTFEYSLDGGAYVEGTDPQTFSGLSHGSHTLAVRARDAAGNVDASPASYVWTVDTLAPTAPSDLALESASDTGDAGDNVTADNTPTVNGIAESGSTVVVYVDGQSAGSTLANASGEWSFTVPTALSDGDHSITADATDAAGNISAISDALSILVDTIAPETFIETGPQAISNSTSATFDVSSNDSGVTFEYSLDGGVYLDGTDPQTFNGLSDGSHTVAVRARDAAGNVDSSPASYAWTIDTLAPAAPTAVTLDSASDTGAAGDNITSNNTPTFNGTAEPGSTVNLFVDGQAAGSSIADASGEWSITLGTALSDGSHSITATATDAAGNDSALSDALSIVLDTIAPETAITSGPPNSTSSTSATLEFTSSESGGSIQCSLDGGSYQTCTSPNTVTGLSGGTHTMRVRAIDAAGNIDATPAAYTWTIITGASANLIPDECCGGGRTALVVQGTSGDDKIRITPVGNSGTVQVSINGTSYGTFLPTGRIIVYALNGDDDVEIAGSIEKSGWLFGGAGNDRLKGGNGHDVLLGGEDDDKIEAGSGEDLLIGGTGADRLVGNADDDLLIAGTTDYDNHDAALCAILLEWSSGAGTRTDRLKRLNGATVGMTFTLTDATVHDDNAVDVLTGAAGKDWFFYNKDGPGARDIVTDKPEYEMDID